MSGRKSIAAACGGAPRAGVHVVRGCTTCGGSWHVMVLHLLGEPPLPLPPLPGRAFVQPMRADDTDPYADAWDAEHRLCIERTAP